METIFWGNRIKMNTIYIFIAIVGLVLNYLNFTYYRQFNFFSVLILLTGIYIFGIFTIEVFCVFTNKDFDRIINSSFKRLKFFMYLFIMILVIMSFILIKDKNISIFGYDLIFVQRSIAFLLFVVTIMNYDVIKKVDEIEFKLIKQNYYEPKIEFYCSKNLNEDVVSVLELVKPAKVIYDKVKFSSKYNYESIIEQLFNLKYVKSEEGSFQSTIRNFLKFIGGEEQDQKLIWLETNSTRTKESTCTCLVLLMREIIEKYNQNKIVIFFIEIIL